MGHYRGSDAPLLYMIEFYGVRLMVDSQLVDGQQGGDDQGQLVVLTGPSGAGKGTLLAALCQKYPELYISVSATTRSPRPGEIDGEHYFFLDRPQFDRMVTQGEFLEWAEFAGNCYGTPRSPVVDQINQGRIVILEIELEGARQVRQNFPAALRVFIMPPSFEELESRLRGRGTESDAVIARRLQRAKAEIEAAGEFDVQILNDDFDQAVQLLEATLFRSAAPVPG
jgi:guanylate kinase